MNNAQAREFLSRVFQSFFDSNVSAEKVGHYFASTYIQCVDGKTLDYEQFVRHAQALKNLLAEATVRFETVAVEGTTVASHHVVSLRKKSGEFVQIRVMAFFEIENGLIQRTDELSHVFQGDSSDHDLGSRT